MTVSFNQVADIMNAAPVVPVITIENVKDAVPLAQALVKGGLKSLEITLRTKAALESIKEIAAAVPDAYVGAGTVLTPKQMEQVQKAGATFCVSPGTTADLIDTARSSKMKLLPGVVTPSEVMALLDAGIDHLKFFPAAAAGGVPYLKGIGGPLPQAKFCPTGGVNPGNAAEYLALPNVLCVGGTWVCPKDLVAAGNWTQIEVLAHAAAQLPR